jgi:hypothetical protein
MNSLFGSNINPPFFVVAYYHNIWKISKSVCLMNGVTVKIGPPAGSLTVCRIRPYRAAAEA